MAPEVSFCFGLFFLFFEMISANPFGFQSLEGCHKGQNMRGLADVKRYLNRFGYWNYDQHPKSGDLNAGAENTKGYNDEFDDSLESAIRAFQLNFDLRVTGSLDSATVTQMMRPRCGVPDVHGKDRNNKDQNQGIHTVGHFQFISGPRKWPQTNLTYRFNSSAQVPDSLDYKSVIQNAFQTWAKVTQFTFKEVSDNSPANIEIGFHRGNHGDMDAFDGPNGTFAHAFAPTDGRCHFDADEKWSSNPGGNELDLESIAVHEIGHLLGLDHEPSTKPAIMYPFFNYGAKKRDLHKDDIDGIKALYELK